MSDRGLSFDTRDDWLAARQSRIGGSEVAALFGVQPDYALSHYALWQVKAGKIPAPEVTGDRPKWGLKLESVIAEAVAEDRDWLVTKGGYIPHPTVPGMACTLDFEATGNLDAPHGMADTGCLECKNADWLQHKRSWGDEPPTHIQLQLQQQLACTGNSWGAVACLIGGNKLEVYLYERRPKIIAEIERRVAAFWASIEKGVEPPVDGTDSTADAIKALFPETNEPAPIDLTHDNELPQLCAQYLQISGIRRQAKKDEQAAKNGILAKMGSHDCALTAGYRIRAPSSGGNDGHVVTREEAESLIGKVMGERASSRRVNIKESTL